MLQELSFKPEQAAFIRTVPLFSEMEKSELSGVINDAKFCAGKKKKILFRQGDPATHFYVIASGVVRLFHTTPEGSEITTDIRKEKDTLGTTGLLKSSGTHHSSAEIVEDVALLAFSRDDFIRYIKMPAFAFSLLSCISRRIDLKNLEAEHHMTMLAPQIISCFLQRLCFDGRHDPSGFDLPYSKSLIAMRLGMKLETFSRALHKLQEMGIFVTGRRVSFRDLKNVESHACAECSYQDSCAAYKFFVKSKQGNT